MNYKLVILVEEPSMKAMLDKLLERIIPEHIIFII